jgi:hypothetical protein
MGERTGHRSDPAARNGRGYAPASPLRLGHGCSALDRPDRCQRCRRPQGPIVIEPRLGQAMTAHFNGVPRLRASDPTSAVRAMRESDATAASATQSGHSHRRLRSTVRSRYVALTTYKYTVSLTGRSTTSGCGQTRCKFTTRGVWWPPIVTAIFGAVSLPYRIRDTCVRPTALSKRATHAIRHVRTDVRKRKWRRVSDC